MIGKACVLLTRRGGTDLLLFSLPLAGWQLVKGTIEPGERAADAAAREFAEETGHPPPPLTPCGVAEHLPDQTWAFFHGHGDALPDRWTHRCADDGGQVFSFHWHRRAALPPLDAIYARALKFLP